MTPAFGFSAGDFITAARLLHKVISALRNVDGAKSQYCHAILELEGLQTLLRTIQSFQLASANSEHAEKLRLLGHQCHLPLENFLKKIEKHEHAFEMRSSTRTFRSLHHISRTGILKAHWVLRVQKHLLDLKAAIGPQLLAIDILLQLINLEQQVKVRSAQDEMLLSSQELHAKIEQLNHHLDIGLQTLGTLASLDDLARPIQELLGRFDHLRVHVTSQDAPLLLATTRPLATPGSMTYASSTFIEKPENRALSGNLEGLPYTNSMPSKQPQPHQQLVSSSPMPAFSACSEYHSITLNMTLRVPKVSALGRSVRSMIDRLQLWVNVLLIKLFALLSLLDHLTPTLHTLPINPATIMIRPLALRTDLLEHQKVALAAMLRQEVGWTSGNKRSGVWEVEDTSQGQVYVNRISGTHQDEAPPQSYGGILADPDCLGKALTLIALTATDLNTRQSLRNRIDTGKDGRYIVKATLIVVPGFMLAAWESELLKHTQSGGLKYLRHHGKSRLSCVNDANSVNIVFTTYKTIVADWKTWKSTFGKSLFSVQWRRVILDEAHILRRLSSSVTRAVCSIDSVSRWAVTGVPTQIRLEDLGCLVKFLRAFPYDDPKQFEGEITQLVRSGALEEARKRVTCLSRNLIVRNEHCVFWQLGRSDLQYPVDFEEPDEIKYESLRQQTITDIDTILSQVSDLSTSSMYIQILRHVESMRRMCNLGQGYHYTRCGQVPVQIASRWTSVAESLFTLVCKYEPITCTSCSSIYDSSLSTIHDPDSLNTPCFSRCLKYACSGCSSIFNAPDRYRMCNHIPRCPTAPVSLSFTMSGRISNPLLEQLEESSAELPPKVIALLADIIALPLGSKCLVLSSCDKTLRIVMRGVRRKGIAFVRPHSGMLFQTQEACAREFTNEASAGTSVMLLSIPLSVNIMSLTLVNRIYIMEPHWNPKLEEKVLELVHRIGLRQGVTTVRFYVRNSIEERIMEYQSRISQAEQRELLLEDSISDQENRIATLQMLKACLMGITPDWSLGRWSRVSS